MIYQMFVARQPGDEEPDEYRRGVYEKMDEVIKSTGTNLFLYCNTRWSNEEYVAFGSDDSASNHGSVARMKRSEIRESCPRIRPRIAP